MNQKKILYSYDHKNMYFLCVFLIYPLTDAHLLMKELLYYSLASIKQYMAKQVQYKFGV